MKKIILFVFSIMLLISCSKDEIKEPIQKNDRLSFNNMTEFNETYLTLSKFTSKEDLQYWAQSKKHSTLLSSEDSSIVHYSDALKTILNKDFEYEIGDSIIWLNNGNLYAFVNKDRSTIEELKKDTKKCNLVGSINIQKIDNSNIKGVELGLNRLDARNQKEFTQQYYQPCGGTRNAISGTRKYVHEIYDESFFSYPGPVIYSYLHLRVKLEYWGRKSWRKKGWKPAGEQREIRINVSGNAHIYPSGAGGAFYVPNRTFDCSGDVDIVIADVIGAYPWTPHWEVSMEGTIYQKIKGDISSNEWYNSGILW